MEKFRAPAPGKTTLELSSSRSLVSIIVNFFYWWFFSPTWFIIFTKSLECCFFFALANSLFFVLLSLAFTLDKILWILRTFTFLFIMYFILSLPHNFIYLTLFLCLSLNSFWSLALTFLLFKTISSIR